MQTHFLSESPELNAADPGITAIDKSASAHDARRLAPPGKPNFAIAGILLGCPVMIIAFVTLLSAGRPILETVLIAYGLQFLVFCVVVLLGLTVAKAPERAGPASNDSVYRSPAAADIWRTYPSSVRSANPVRIALIAPDMTQSRMIATDLAQLGVEVHHSTDRDAMLESVHARPQDWGAVMVDLDAGSELDACRTDVSDFRDACPDIPVLLMSGTVFHADPSPHGQSIGDVTLQKPVLRKHLVASLAAMKLNFVARQRDDADVPIRSAAAITTT